jgi:23S rRNA pseudouridine2605 synthase
LQQVRLATYIAHAGIASRRAAAELVRSGRVTVDGVLEVDPACAIDGERVMVDGAMLAGPESHITYLLNKPPGVVSTARDTHGRPTVTSLVSDARDRRLYPVGRLDASSRGLILLTNDGELANLLTHPRYEVPKTYRAKVAGGPVRRAALAALRNGVSLEDGMARASEVRRVSGSEIEIVLHEGRKRQVRRMCEAVGHRVLDLERTRIGSLDLGSLAPGRYRALSPRELETLRAQARTDVRS